MSKFLPRSEMKWIDPKEFDFTRNSSNRCALKEILNLKKELCKLDNDYPWAPDEIEIKGEMLSKIKIKIGDF